MRLPLVCLAATAFLLLPGCAEGDDRLNLLTGTVVMDPNGGPFGSAEVDVMTQNGAGLFWKWWTEDGQELYFELHRHTPDGGSITIDDHRGDGDEQEWSVAGGGARSLLWVNPGEEPVTLRYEVWGAYELLGVYPPQDA
ncbi:MAG: hypothetical protein ACPGQL_05310 [Thermoplasmatota archaeon]